MFLLFALVPKENHCYWLLIASGIPGKEETATCVGMHTHTISGRLQDRTIKHGWSRRSQNQDQTTPSVLHTKIQLSMTRQAIKLRKTPEQPIHWIQGTPRMAATMNDLGARGSGKECDALWGDTKETSSTGKECQHGRVGCTEVAQGREKLGWRMRGKSNRTTTSSGWFREISWLLF